MADVDDLPITLVCGFGRCGTSLALQMLHAGGHPVPGEHPTFETRCPSWMTGQEWWASLRGKAVKVLDIHEKVLDTHESATRVPPSWFGYRYRALWLDRHPHEQAASQQKFMSAFVPPEMIQPGALSRPGRRALMRSLTKDRPVALDKLRRLCGADSVWVWSFEKMLRDPVGSAALLDTIVGGGLDRTRMAAVVVPRPPTCLPDFLEMRLLGP